MRFYFGSAQLDSSESDDKAQTEILTRYAFFLMRNSILNQGFVTLFFFYITTTIHRLIQKFQSTLDCFTNRLIDRC